MELYYMRQEVMEDLKNNLEYNLENYKNDSNQWIFDQYENPFLEYKRSVKDFELVFDPESIGDSDIENVKILHSNLQFLSKLEAADERFWAGLTHSVFWNFMRDRWSIRPIKSERDVSNRYFFSSGTSDKRGQIMNTLSRYWWIGDLLYDEDNLEDPYYLIETFRGDFTTSVHTLLSSNYTSNSSILKGVLRPILNYQKVNGKLSRSDFEAILRYANLLGGTYLLDYLSTEEIEDKISAYMDKLLIDREHEKEVSEVTIDHERNINDMAELKEENPNTKSYAIKKDFDKSSIPLKKDLYLKEEEVINKASDAINEELHVSSTNKNKVNDNNFTEKKGIIEKLKINLFGQK